MKNKSALRIPLYTLVAVFLCLIAYALKGKYDVQSFDIGSDDAIVLYHENLFRDKTMEWKYDVYIKGRLASANNVIGEYRGNPVFSGNLRGDIYRVRLSGRDIMTFDVKRKSLSLSRR